MYLIVDIDGTICKLPKYKDLNDFHNLDHHSFESRDEVISLIVAMLNAVPETKLVFLTARSAHLDLVSVRYIDTHFPDGTLPEDWDIILRPLNNHLPSPQFKLNTLKAHGIMPDDVLYWIDDDMDVLIEANKAGYTMMDAKNIEKDNFYNEL